MDGELRSRTSVLLAALLWGGVLAGLTVGAVSLGTRSGGVVLVLAAVGLTLVVFVGGTGDAFSSSAATQTGHLGGVPGETEAGHGWNPSGGATESWSEAALLYGLGLLVWSVLALVVLWDTLA